MTRSASRSWFIPGGTTIPLEEILGRLVAGDVVTHVYHGRSEGALDDSGRVRPSVRSAIERGVNFDVGHGAGSFEFRVARQALEQGLLPGTISSDIHVWNIAGPVLRPRDDREQAAAPGTLTVGCGAAGDDDAGAVHRASGSTRDAAAWRRGGRELLRLVDGEFRFVDAAGAEEIGGARFEPVKAIRDGRVYDCVRP